MILAAASGCPGWDGAGVQGELGRRGRCLLQVSEGALGTLGRAVLVAAVPVTSPEGLSSLYLNKMRGKFYLPYIYIYIT